MIVNFLKNKYYSIKDQMVNTYKAPPLPLLEDGRKGVDILKGRVLSRFRHSRSRFTKDRHEETFSGLFDLPPWLDTTGWLTIQLRGRGVDSLYLLTLDHIVPLSQARDEVELKKLMSWKNTRLLDKEMNEAKGSKFDPESRYLCYSLLGSYPDEDDWQEQNILRVKQFVAKRKAKQNKRRRNK